MAPVSTDSVVVGAEELARGGQQESVAAASKPRAGISNTCCIRVGIAAAAELTKQLKALTAWQTKCPCSREALQGL